MTTESDWTMFLKEIDDKAYYSLLNVATDDSDIDKPVAVDILLKDPNFMYFYKDILISDYLTQDLHEKDHNVAFELLDIFYKGIKKSEDEEVKNVFNDLKEEDKDFLFVLMKKLLLTFGIKKHYEKNYKLYV